MLTDLVTHALSQLMGTPLDQDRIKGRFRYAYASDDGQFVAILGHDHTTYVVDVPARRYCAECGGLPRGFAGHVLEMEGQPPGLSRQAANEAFDLDMDADDIPWRRCPGPRAHFTVRGGRARAA
ncbi:hypothetical protein [Bordetella petrii]|uniref:hypothetical protein n=1 Tax=Bordetella petrii TaxID=94624 RepID=UPI001E343544|nr:hypothetical protein [Bordetella petrii]MCD0502558.1 hypothetical protein [Bordetella petrii]